MVKLRLMGTQDDLNWFAKVLCNIKGIKVIRMSEKYLNKGTTEQIIFASRQHKDFYYMALDKVGNCDEA